MPGHGSGARPEKIRGLMPEGVGIGDRDPIKETNTETNAMTPAGGQTSGDFPPVPPEEYVHESQPPKPGWWTLVRRRRLFFIGMGLFITIHLGFFLALSPFTNWWPTNPGESCINLEHYAIFQICPVGP